ncbi:phosphopyruvate hydratase [Candidatus Fermentibacteria bacterium]|nr:phosphopyruvate hydratase [Candidatus Fermentibacteria bacterium]
MLSRTGTIKDVAAWEVLDSRGNPTVAVEVKLFDGTSAVATVPSGASTGTYEALELRDGDKKRYRGLGVLQAVKNVNQEIRAAVVGISVTDQISIDQKMIALDGTDDKSRLGANAILGVSLAAAHAAAKFLNIPLYRHLGGSAACTLPVPMLNILNGGKHAHDSTDLQEFMVVPSGAENYAQALRIGSEVYHALRSVLQENGLNTNVGDEGGFAPSMKSNRQAVEMIIKAIEKAGYKPGKDCFIALDPAASSFYEQGKYQLAKEKASLTSKDMVNYYAEWVANFPIISIEDGMAEDDWEGWHALRDKLGQKVQLVGDDLYATNMKRLERGITGHASNSVLVKPNQVGTLTESIKVIRRARQVGWTSVISHRSGETEDTTIADLAVAMNTGLIKTGAPCRSERNCKYNRLLRIEQELGPEGRFPGQQAFFSLGK